MAAKLVEQVLVREKTLLQASLGAIITTINSDRNDGIILQTPQSTSYSINEVGKIVNLPFIQILPDLSENEQPGVYYDIFNHNIIIVAHVWSRQGKIEECSYRAYRMAEAIWQVIRNNPAPSGLISHTVTSIDYKPMFADERGFKQEVWVHVTAKEQEA